MASNWPAPVGRHFATHLSIFATVALATWGVAAQSPAQPGSRSVVPNPGLVPNGPDQKPAFVEQTKAPRASTHIAVDVVAVAEGLVTPWSLTFLPDGRILVAEKGLSARRLPGNLRIVGDDGTVSEPIAGLPIVDARGQGGLLDVTIDPDYAQNRLIYWSYAEPREGGASNTTVARGKLVERPAPHVDDVQVIFRQARSMVSPLHFGSRLVWNRDGTLFVTLGDRAVIPGRIQAQNLDSLVGKIARIHAGGSIPNDNPFVDRAGVRGEIWSIGHRNIQAATLHPTTGELWIGEHGTRGGDEVNIVRKGRDYGWPTIAYGVEYEGGPITGGIQQHPGMEQPAYYWDPNIAPSGMLFYTGNLFPAWKGNLFIGGLAARALVRLVVNGEKIISEERLLIDQKERIRDVEQGPDGALYLATDSPQGRILRVTPASVTLP